MLQFTDYPDILDYGNYFVLPYNIQTTEFGYEADTVEVSSLKRDVVIQSLIKRKYSTDDEVALINNYNTGEEKYLEEYADYLQYRANCKETAETICALYSIT